MSQALPQRYVSFEGDELIGVQDMDGTVYAVFARFCDNLTLTREGQVRRVRSHAVLSTGLVMLMVETLGGPQQVQCLKLSLVPLWLTTIQANRIKDTNIREKLIRYQQEAADVLWQAFRRQIIREDTPLTEESSLAVTQLEQIIEQSRAMQRIAEEQITIIRRMDTAARVVKGLQGDVAAIHVRLGVLEDKASPAALITNAQAAEVSTKVKAVAELLTKRDPAKNHYQGIFTELYRRFNVSSYKLLRREQFESVLAFLDDWQRAGETNT